MAPRVKDVTKRIWLWLVGFGNVEKFVVADLCTLIVGENLLFKNSGEW